MNQNRQKNLSLFFIILGSGILAIPGTFGAFFLVIAALDSDSLGLLLPVSLLGYFLLGGYVWTMLKNKFVKWFWLTSAIYNLLITLVSGFFIVKMNYESQSDTLLRLTFLLFPIWTIFVCVTSFKYAFRKQTTEDLNLP